MAWSDEKWMLHQVNASRKEGEEEITFENAKKANIPASIRLALEKSYGKEKVAKIFGEASHLQKAEMMILEIEQGEITKEKKYSNIIDIAYCIENACGVELELPLWKEYADLSSKVPIEILERKNQDSILDFSKSKVCVAAEDLEKMKTWLFLTEEPKKEPEKKVFFEYIFELAYISLNKIVKEIFFAMITGIMGE